MSCWKVGGEESKLHRKIYDVKVHSFGSDDSFMIKAIGIDSINTIVNPEQDTDSLRKALDIVDAVHLRESGPIDLLIGVDHAGVCEHR